MRDASNRFINPISIADSATSYPFGYDTIKFTLKQDDCPEYDLMSEVPIMVGENGPEILSAQPGATVTPLTKINAAHFSGWSRYKAIMSN